MCSSDLLASLVEPQLQRLGVESVDQRLPRICALFKDRCETTVALAQWARVFYAGVNPPASELAQHVTPAVLPAVTLLGEKLGSVSWDKTSIAAAIKEVLAACGLKMPQLAMAVRVLVLGTSHTPSLDAVLELCHRQVVLERLSRAGV